jgi:ACS family glucarate transporter-like MFS transporter
MSNAAADRPTQVRYQVLAAMTAASVILYVHRAFISEVLKLDYVLAELGLLIPAVLPDGTAVKLPNGEPKMVPDATRLADTYSAFFLSYALCQVPAGWFADRFGRRLSLFLYVVSWSICTALGGLVTGFASLFVVRLALGIAQAGAYPTSGGLVGRWIPLAQRTLSSAMVGAGGRAGGIIAPILTMWLIKTLGVPWRVVILLYGLIGVAIGVWFWLVSRDEPTEHPGCNDAELALIAEGRSAADLAGVKTVVRAPIVEMLTSPSMWCMGLMQFGTNVGWAFIITTWPTYLKDVKNASDLAGGGMTSMIWTLGVIGLLLGGRATDVLSRVFGLRWGRMILTIASRFIAAALYAFVYFAQDPLAASIAMAAVVFVCDIGVPATWSFAQDVGGKSVGAVLGWGNMFGNLGAAAATQIYAWADRTWGTVGPDGLSNMEGTVYAAMTGFIVSGIAALGINCTKPLVPEENETSAG